MKILSLGDKIKSIRKNRDITLQDLAEDKFTSGQISSLESGKENNTIKLLKHISNKLDISIDYLFESEESQAKKICDNYYKTAECYFYEGDYKAAEKILLKSNKYIDEYKLNRQKADVLYLLSRIDYEKGEYDKARHNCLSANVIYTIENDNNKVVETLFQMGKISHSMNSIYSAVSYFKQAEAVIRENNIDDNITLVSIYFYLAKSYYLNDMTEEAIVYAGFCEEKLNECSEERVYARKILKEAKDGLEHSDIKSASKLTSKASLLYKDINRKSQVGLIENNLADLFSQFEDNKRSIIHYNRARNIRTYTKDKALINTLISICSNYILIKDIKNCEELLNHLYSLINENEPEYLIKCNLIKYRLLSIKNVEDDAEMLLLNTYNYAKDKKMGRTVIDIGIMLAKLYCERKDETKAKKYLDESVLLYKKEGLIER